MHDETPWLDAAQLRSWMALMAVVEALPAALDAQLRRDAGINHFEYLVLAGLSEAPGRAMPMSDLAGFATGSMSRLSHAVARLEQRGWVTRRTMPAGPRRVEAVLTEEGMAMVAATAPGHVREARRLVIDALDPAQTRQLDVIARAILAAPARHVLDALEERGPGAGAVPAASRARRAGGSEPPRDARP